MGVLKPTAPAPAAAMTKIASLTIVTSAFDFQNIPQTFSHLQVRGVIRGQGASISERTLLQLNGANGNVYSSTSSDNGTISTFLAQAYMRLALFNAANAVASTFSPFVIDIPNYRSTSRNKSVFMQSAIIDNVGANNQFSFGHGYWPSGAAVTRVYFSGTFNGNTDGTADLYGIA